VSCHLCRKVVKTRVVEPMEEMTQFTEIDNTVPQSNQPSDQISQKKKKKRKKDKNAGLNIPGSNVNGHNKSGGLVKSSKNVNVTSKMVPSTEKVASSKNVNNQKKLVTSNKVAAKVITTNKTLSKDKLKFLMSKVDTPKRGGLQDFLKQL